MPTPQIPQNDPYPQITSGKFPAKVKDILRQNGVNFVDQEREFQAAIQRGGADKENAVRSAYQYFDEIQGTSQYKTALDSYDRQRERSVTVPSRNEVSNSGLAAPRPSSAVIGGEDIGLSGPTYNVDATGQLSGSPAAAQPTQAGTSAPATQQAVASQSAAAPAREDIGVINLAARGIWNSVVEKGKGIAQMILSGQYLTDEEKEDRLFEQYSQTEAGRNLLDQIKDMNAPGAKPLTGRALRDKQKFELADREFKRKSVAISKWFDENLKAGIPTEDQQAPFYYDKQSGNINFDNITDTRSWVNTIASSAGGTLLDFGVAAIAARATKGKSPRTVAATKNMVRAYSFISSTAQMFPGYVQEGLDNGLSYGDAIKVAGPLSVVNGAIEMVGMEFVMKGVGLGKMQAQAVVRDVLDKSAQAAIKQLVKKEITTDAFLDTVKRTAMASFKNIGSKQNAAAAKLFFEKAGQKALNVIGNGALPEMGEEALQGGMEFAAKELYNKAVAAKGAKPGEGKFDNNRGEALTNTLLGVMAAGFSGGTIGMAYTNPKLYDQTMFSYANSDIRHQLSQGASNLTDVKSNGKIYQKINQWAQQGQFDVPQNGTTVFDQQAYDQAIQNADMMYDTAWEFRNFKDFDDMTRLDMFKVAKTRRGLQEAGAEIETSRSQIEQIDQWIADPASVPADEYGERPSQIMLENQKAEIQRSLGRYDESTGLYEAESRFQNLNDQMENIIRQGIPQINDTDNRRVGRSFIASGLNAIQSLQDPTTDTFVADYEAMLPDGTMVVMNEATPDTDAYARRLIAEPIAGTVLDQIDTGSYKPVDRTNWSTAPIENFDQYTQAVNSSPTRIKKDTTRKYNVGDDANELLATAADLVTQAASNPATAGTLTDQVDKIYDLYTKVAAHPDAVDDGVRELTRPDFDALIGLPAAEAQVETVAAPAAEPTPTAEAAPQGVPAGQSVRSLLDAPVMYNGQRANLSLDGKTVIAEPIGTNQMFEVGNIDEIGDLPSSQFSITPETNVANINEDGTITVRDKVYRNGYSNPLSAIHRNKSGEITSVTLSEVTENGKSRNRTFRGQTAQDIAYEIILQENSKDSGTERQFNDFVESNQFVRDEIMAGEAEIAAQATAEQAANAVPGSPSEGAGAGTEGGTTNPTVDNAEISQQPGTNVDTPESPTLQSQYVAARELSELTSDIEQRQESLRSAVESADESAGQVQDGGEINNSLSGLIRSIESVVAEAGRVDNQIEAAIGQIVDEVITEPSDSDNSTEGTASPEPSSTAEPARVEPAPVSVVRTPVSEINTDTDRFQNRDAEFSESSVQSIMNAVETGKFNPGKFDPVRLWTDPKDNKTYVLAGHSRREAFRRLNEAGRSEFATIPSVFLNELSEQEAINYALNESNTLATQETDLEGAAAWRRMREAGKRDSQIRNDIGNRQNKARLELLSYLNPKGKVMDILKSTQSASASNTTRVNQVAEFIGEAFKVFGGQLTNSHENEMFEYLTEGPGKKITKRSDFIDRLNNIVSNFSFDPKQPLNLANRATKGSAQVEAENYYNELLQQKKELEAERAAAKSEETMAELDSRIRTLNKKIVDANRAIADARAGDRQQVSLFSFQNPVDTVGPNPIMGVLNQISKAFPNVLLNIPESHQAYLDMLNSLPNTREIFTPGSNVPYGYINVDEGSVNLDPSRLNANTALHEYGHIWTTWAKANRPDLYQKGIDLVKVGPYADMIRKSPNYTGLSNQQIYEEALATAIGDKGESFVLASRKKNFKDWLASLFNTVRKFFGIRNMDSTQVQDLDFESFVNGVVADLLSGETVSEMSSLQVSDILNQAGYQPEPEGSEISEEEFQDNYDRTGQILFSFRPPAVWGTRPGESVGTAVDFKTSAEAALSPALAAKRQSDFTAADKREIARIHQETGWEFTGFNEKTKELTWQNDISKATNPDLKTNEFLFTDDGRIVRMPMRNPSSKTRGAIAQTVINGTKLMLDDDSPGGRFLNFFAKRLRLANAETVVDMIDDENGLITQLIKNVKREGTARRSLARVYMMDTFSKYQRAMAPFTTFNGSTQGAVRKIKVTGIIQGADGKLRTKEVYMPVGYAMNLARTEMSQRAMGEKYLTQTAADGVEETHSSLVLDDRHFLGSSLADPNDTSILYGKDGVHKGAHFMINEIEEMDVTGKLVPFKDSFGKEAESVRIAFTNAEMNRLIGRFQRGIGAELGEKEAFDIGTEFFNKKEVTDMLAEENDKFLNPSDPFKRVSFYAPLNVMTQVRAESKVNSFSPSLEDSRRLHERKTRPDALGIQDDLRTAQYYMDGVSNILGYGRLVHNLKNVRDAIQREVVDLPNGKQIIGYLDEYIEDLQNFQQARAKKISDSITVRALNFIMNKNTAFIFRGGIGIALTQSSTWTSAFGQGHIKDTYLRKAFPYLAGYSAGAFTDSFAGAGATVNQETGDGKTTALGTRTIEADMIDYITGANITDPVKKARHLRRFSTIIDRGLYGNNKFINGVDLFANTEARKTIIPGKVGSFLDRTTSQFFNKVDAFFEEYGMAPMRRTDRAVIFTFVKAAQMQVADEGLTGDAAEARIAQIVENTIYATNQMNDLNDASGLQRSSDPITKIITIYTGQGQKLFNNLMQSFIQWNKFGKKSTTPDAVKNRMLKRLRGSLASNLIYAPLWVAGSRIAWSIIKSLAKGDEPEKPKDYAGKVFFEWLRSVGSIVPGWTEQLSSIIISRIDNEKWEQGTIDFPGLEIAEGAINSTIDLVAHMLGKEGNEEKIIEQFNFNMTKLGAMLAGIPKIFSDIIYSRFIDEDKKKVSKPSTTDSDPTEEEFDDLNFDDLNELPEEV